MIASIAPAGAQEIIDFDIARGDLATVVTAIARTSGTAVSFPAELAQGRMAGPINTRASTQAALDSALAGSGLEAVPLAAGGMTIRASDAGSAAAPIEGDVEAIDVTDLSGGQHGDEGFKAGDAGESVRLGDAPIKEIPIPVTAVTQDVIASQGMTTTTDAVRNVAGVTVVDSSTTGRAQYRIRGFDASEGSYTVNGQQAAPDSTTPIDSVERVEVLKGPTSILTGKSGDGGLVNIVLKKPTEETIRDLTVRYGTDNKMSLALDMAGIVPGTEDFTYRFVTSGLRANETEAGYHDPNEFLFFPSLKWTGEDLTVSASVNYVKQRIVRGTPYAVLLQGLDPAGAPISELLRMPAGLGLGNPDFHKDVESLTWNSEQSYDAGTIFGGIDVTFDNTVEYTHGSSSGGVFETVAGEPGSTIFAYGTSYNESDSGIFTTRPSMTLTYDGDVARSTLKVGYDYQRNANTSGSATGPEGLIDVLTGTPVVPIFTGDPVDFNDTVNTSQGLYAIEKLDLFDNRLHLLGSVRQDWQRDTFDMNSERISDDKTDGVSYVIGAAFDITDDLTAYVNHSDGFSPQGPVDGRPVPPEGRTLNEAGLRYSLFDERLSVTTSVYDLTATNVTIFDFDTTPITFIPTKGQRSRGVEVEVQGEVMPGWNIIASATVLKSVSLDEESTFDPTSGNPKYQGSFWTTYTLPEDTALQGVTLGIGARAVSATKANTNVEDIYYDLGGYMVADAMVGFERGAFSADLKVNNIFDTDAIQPSLFTRQMTLEAGRSWQLTARYRF